MSHYHKSGKIPHKRHTQFRKDDGSLFHEQLISTEGFSDIYSLVYHTHAPTKILEIGEPIPDKPEIAVDVNLQHRSFAGFNIRPESDYLKSRKAILVNSDVHILLAAPMESMKDYFFKNSGAHEMIFIHQGEGILRTIYGSIRFCYGDQMIIPRGTIYRMEFNTRENRLLILESVLPFRFPRRYTNRAGQLSEQAPFCERDIKKPENLETHDEKGSFLIKIKRDGMIFPYFYQYHPFDLVGWDGYLYPFALSVHDFEPITGRIHQPPPVHQTFENDNFVTCAFVPRLFDYHPQAIPAPYYHSNVDSDEVLYYVDGDFMSRKHVEKGMITLHPTGIPHGPHPGTVNKSIGKKETNELAIMVDTFKPLKLTSEASGIEDPDYFKSWLE
ncbi:MAG: homogentisate 1,2-dioxygenase [Bacteroidales bacterium]|nr:homogentisate 1,2-dioxygenase [Bacteroidales bacterium]